MPSSIGRWWCQLGAKEENVGRLFSIVALAF
jgi:hypothetical protein